MREFQGVVGENFYGIPGGVQFLKMDILNRGYGKGSGKAHFKYLLF